jgi:TonB-linked SusC/RagA family outer membrane protein
MCACIFSLSAQQRAITGAVTDENGDPMPGVNVTVRGSMTGTTTNINGEFLIQAPADTSVLLFSFVGYRPQEIVVGNRLILPVSMQEAAAELEEVTIVAFGKQKKESVVASITTINPAELKVPSSNLTTALAGNMAGIIAYQRSGEPGQDNADFFVRGITTFGSNIYPLILIDGIELTSTDLARLQPDDIASFSIMKDATATALYGARGANGVILVTTKQGADGPAKISVRIENSISSSTRNVDIADPITFMKLSNEAVLTRNPLGVLPYSENKIAGTADGSDPVYYPANDWMDMLLKNYAMNQRANLSVSGGGGVARYYVAASFSKDNGILKVDKRQNFNNNIDNKTYTLRANVNIDITKTTEIAVRLNGVFDDYSGPLTGGADMYNLIMHSNPVLFPAYYPVTEETQHVKHIMFGNYGRSYDYINPYAEMVKGYKDKSRSQMLAQLEAKQDLNFLTEGLSFKGMINISRLAQFSVNRFYNPNYYAISSYDKLTGKFLLTSLNEGTEYLDYSEDAADKITNSTFYFEGMINYARDFAEKHSVSGVLVYIVRNSLNANTGSLQLSLPSRNLGLSGRLTYGYDKRYFAEFNFGYNGSERFHISKRYGFFPSFGGAWNISNESFWEPLKPVVSNLKLRYSYGLVGNDQIGQPTDRFYYLSEVVMNDGARGASFGENLGGTLNGISVKRYANEDITWETAVKQNMALELGLWEKVNIIAEYFTEHRRNILMDRASIPATMGLSAPNRANVGEATGHGVDLSLEYQQSWHKDLWMSARGNLTYATSKYHVYEEPQYDELWRYRTGKPIYQQFGYIAERLFVDDTEAANAPRQEISTDIYGGGDIKYIDVNNDGKITEIDMVPVGNPTVPEIVFGFGFSVGYKGWDASVFFQGAANESFWMDAVSTAPFYGETQLLQAYADSHWSEADQNVYALWPRLSPTINENNTPTSTWFMRDGAFLRLKQAEIGYTLPGKWQQKFRIQTLRFYVNATNLFLWSKFKLWDVEMAGKGLGYPIQRVVNIGVNLSFN